MMADLPNGHPGCMVATVCYQERLFDAEVRELNRQGGAGLAHAASSRHLERIAERYPPRDDGRSGALADMVSTVVEGGIVMSKALREPMALAEQVLLHALLHQAPVRARLMPRRARSSASARRSGT